MSRFLADLKAAAKIYTRSKAGMFFTFMLPVLLMVLFGAGLKGLEEMRRQGVDATLDNEDVIVSVTDPSRIEHWFASLSEAGVEVKDMSIRRDTLEDVFLSLISVDKAKGVAQ